MAQKAVESRNPVPGTDIPWDGDSPARPEDLPGDLAEKGLDKIQDKAEDLVESQSQDRERLKDLLSRKRANQRSRKTNAKWEKTQKFVVRSSWFPKAAEAAELAWEFYLCHEEQCKECLE